MIFHNDNETVAFYLSQSILLFNFTLDFLNIRKKIVSLTLIIKNVDPILLDKKIEHCALYVAQLKHCISISSKIKDFFEFFLFSLVLLFVCMFLTQFTINFFLFFIGLIGMILNRRNILIILMCIELVLLSLNLNFILFSVYFDDLYGQLFSLFILTIAAAESAVGLAIIIIYFRIRGSISINQVAVLKG